MTGKCAFNNLWLFLDDYEVEGPGARAAKYARNLIGILVV